MDNEFWLDIWGGDSSCDIYEEQQRVLNEFTFPTSQPVIPMVLPNAETFDEDVPF